MLEESSSSAKPAFAFASAAKGYGGQPSPPMAFHGRLANGEEGPPSLKLRRAASATPACLPTPFTLLRLAPPAIATAYAVAEAGRAGETRTHDPLHPMQVRYQAAPRPEPRTDSKSLAAERGKGFLIGLTATANDGR